MKLIQLSVALFIVVACSDLGNERAKQVTLDFSKVVISVPSTWKKFEMSGIDSFVQGMITDKNDTIFIDIGERTVKFNDFIIINSMQEKARLDSLGRSSNERFFSKTPELDQSQGTFLREYYFYDTIDKKVAKLIFPKKIGAGTTGVYFDSIAANLQLTIFTHNLDTLQQQILYNAIKSIKFK